MLIFLTLKQITPMKKNFLIFTLVFSLPFIGLSQDTEEITSEKRNEIKLDAFNLIAFEYVDVSYEHLINEEASFGVNIQFNLDNNDYYDNYQRDFALTPYYRQYFSKKYAAGFFVEGFAMLNSGKDYIYYYDYNTNVPTNSDEKFTDFALGISVGGKFITKRGFIAEIYGGVGRNLLNSSNDEIIGRGGISLGYRF